MTTFVVAVASVIVMALAGCVSPRGIDSKAVLAAPTALGAEGPAAAAPVAADWWRGFDDPVLADLIARATAGNPSLRVAAARAARASANVASAQANEGPQVGGQLDASRQLFSENSFYPPPLAGTQQLTPRRRSSTARGSSTSSAAIARCSIPRSAASAPASPTPTPRASCSRSTSPAPTSSWRARSSSAPCSSARWRSAKRFTR